MPLPILPFPPYANVGWRPNRRDAKLANAFLTGNLTCRDAAMPDLEPSWVARARGSHGTDDGPSPITLLDGRRRFAKLPAPPPTTFVGRRSEIDSALELLRDDQIHLLTLTGAGGIGKTRLALEIAHEFDSELADSIAWVSLAPVSDASLALQAIASAADIDARTDDGLLGQLIAAFARQRTLIVLDNFEHILGAAADLSTLLRACPKLKALVTSRAPLRVSGEHLLVVPPLTLPAASSRAQPDELRDTEAIRLFVDRAVSVAPSFKVDAETSPLVLNICQRLDGLPLAIELAAARLYHLPIRTLNDRLSSRLPLLTGGPADLPARQQTLYQSISWSYELLAPAEQRLLQRLAVFSGGFTIEAAEAVGESEAGTLDQLTALVDKSLVHYQPDTPWGPRYSLLETIHEYAAECLVRSGDQISANQRHAAFFLSLARQAEPEMARGALHEWVGRLEIEHNNLRRALDWLAESQEWATYLEMATALGDFWDTHGHLSEGRARLECALRETGDADVPPASRALAATWLALTLVRQSAFDEAEMHLSMAQRVWADEQNAAKLAFMLCVFGGFAEYRGDDVHAQALYERGLALYREAGDPAGTATVLNNLADTAYRLGDLSGASLLAEEAVTIARDAGLEVIRATTLYTLAEISIARGEWQDALAALGDGMRISRVAGYRLGLADALSGFAVVAAMTGDSERAARLLGAVESIAGEMGARRIPHQALRNRAVALTEGILDEAALRAAWNRGRTQSLTEVILEVEAIQPQPRTPLQGGLTPRELDVLRLLVLGETDRAIGERLFIGTRTVESHVANIFTKLGVHSRAAAIASALAAGIVAPHTPAR